MSQHIIEGSRTILPVAAAALLTRSVSLPSVQQLRSHSDSSLRCQDNEKHKQEEGKKSAIQGAVSQPQHVAAWLARKVLTSVQGPCCAHHATFHSSKEQHIHHSKVATLRRTASSFSLWATAEIVTLEAKYHVLPWVAEFWCTTTSAFFALPAILYLVPMLPPAFYVAANTQLQHIGTIIPVPVLQETMTKLLLACAQFDAASISPFAHMYIALTVLVAVTSTVYHCTLWNVCSVLDVLLATIAFWTNAFYMLQAQNLVAVEPFACSMFSTALIVGAFFIHFRRHSEIAVAAFALGIPLSIWGYYSAQCMHGAILGAIGLTCFVLDRSKLAVAHSMWHIFGGMSMACGVLSMELYRGI